MSRGLLYGSLSFVFLVCLSVYLWTLCPTFQPDDSAEIITACFNLTPPHTPGYPFYTLCGHLGGLLPMGSEAFRLNFFTALLSALVVTLTALYLFHLLRDESSKSPLKNQGKDRTALWAALGGSLSLAFSKTYWAQAITAKGGVYIQQAFTFLALVYLVGVMTQPKANGKEKGWIYPAFGLVMGLGFCSGWETQAVFAAALILFGWIVVGPELKKSSDLVQWLRALSLMVVGFSLFLFLPLRPGRSDLMVWGHPGSLRGFLSFFNSQDSRDDVSMKFLQNLLHFSTRGDDWRAAWEQMHGAVTSLNYISGYLISDIGGWSLPLVLLGMAWLFNKKNHPFLLLGLITIFLLMIAHGVFVRTETENLWCIDKFLLPIDLFESICVGAGIKWILDKMGDIRRKQRGSGNQKGRSPGGSYLVGGLTLGLVFTFPGLSLIEHSKLDDQSRQVWAYDEGTDLLKSLKSDCVFIPEGDNSAFPLLYFQGVLKERRDVTLIPAFYLWTDWGLQEMTRKLPWFSIPPALFQSKEYGQRVFRALEEIRRENKRPLQFSPNLDLLDRCYFSLIPPMDSSKGLFEHLKPFGLSLLWTDREEVMGLDALELLRDRDPQGRGRADEGAMDILFAVESQAYFNAAEYCALNGPKIKAGGYFQTALGLTRNPQLLSRIWQGRGAFWYSLGDGKDALKAFRNSLKLVH